MPKIKSKIMQKMFKPLYFNRNNKNKAFTLTELIIALAIIAVLTIVSYIGIQRTQNLLKNNRMTNDLIAIESALNQYYHDNEEKFPLPNLAGGNPLNMNMLCFTADAAFTECDDPNDLAFYQGQIDNKLLTKRYLPDVPKDPWTDTNYAYGVSKDGKYFMVAGLNQEDNGDFSAYSISNLFKGYHLPSLIRSFSSQNFVIHKGTHLPYSPDPLTISAEVVNPVGKVWICPQAATEECNSGTTGAVPPTVHTEPLIGGDIISTEIGATADIFFSDGSMSRLGEGSRLKIFETSEAEKNGDDNIITKIKLKLFQGKIWNKVVRLAEQSEFNIETNSAIAGVRGTEFGIRGGRLVIYSGSVYMTQLSGETLEDPAFDPVFSPSEEASVDPYAGEPAKAYNMAIPIAAQPLPTPTADELTFIDEGQENILHSGIYPYIVGFDLPAQGGPGFFIAHIGMNGLNAKDYEEDSIDGFEVFNERHFAKIKERAIRPEVLEFPSLPGHEPTETESVLPPGGGGPAVNVLTAENRVVYDEENQIYLMSFEMPTVNSDNRLTLADNSGNSEKIIIRAYREVTDGLGNPYRIYSGFSWPATGFNVTRDSLIGSGYFVDLKESSVYAHLEDTEACLINLTKPNSKDLDSVFVFPEFRWKPSPECLGISNYEVSVVPEGPGTAYDETTIPLGEEFFPHSLPPIHLDPNANYTLTISARDSLSGEIGRKSVKFTTGSDLELESIIVEGPEHIDSTINPVATYNYTARGVYTDDSTGDVTAQCTWTSASDGPSPIGDFDPGTNEFTPELDTTETGRVICTHPDVPAAESPPLAISLLEPDPTATLTAINIAPSGPSSIKSNGSSGTYFAQGIYNPGGILITITDTCTWSVTPASRGAMINNGNRFRPYTGVSGNATLNCSLDGISDLTPRTVSVIGLTSVDIISGPLSISETDTDVEYKAEATYSNTDVVGIDDECTWSVTGDPTGPSSLAGDGTMSDNLFTPTAVGDVTIGCSYSDGATRSDTVDVTITPAGVPTPVILTGPPILPATTNLNATGQLLESDIGCVWTIESGGGQIIAGAPPTDATYLPIGSNTDEDVNDRFLTSNTEDITIRCANTSDNNYYDEYSFRISYAPRIVSGNSGLNYSFAGKSGVTWYEAQATCEGWGSLSAADQTAASSAPINLNPADFPDLEEGGFTDWRLPTGVELVDAPDDDERAFWCNYDSTAPGRCLNMPGSTTKVSWSGTESGAQADRVSSSPGTPSFNINKNTVNANFGFRCVR